MMPFWDFSNAVYMAPGVAAECVLLQDEHKVDVNVLLFCAYAAVIARVRLTDNNLADIERHVADLRSGVIAPLRDCRRRMKGPIAALNNGDRARAENLRSQVKDLELAAERLEQERLIGWLSGSGRLDHRSEGNELEGNVNRLLLRHKVDDRGVSFPARLVEAALALS